MNRPSISKGKRFDVFRRDQFTCQYCGAQPPDVVLVLDHIDPVANGGASTIDNLITACVGCNSGKSDKRLTDVIVRPDAELMYLQTQQEVAEMQRYANALAERRGALDHIVEAWQSQWCSITGGDYMPNDELLRRLAAKYDLETVEYALCTVAVKVGGGLMSMHDDKWVKYLWAVARNYAEGNE